MDKHIQTMKNLLINYHKDARDMMKQSAENGRVYKPEEAERINAQIRERLAKTKDDVKAQIMDARDMGRSAAERWGHIDGAKITEDARLLERGTLSPEQFNALAKKYKDNATMGDLLLKYAEEKGSGGFTAGWNFSGNEQKKPCYDTSMLITGQQKAAVYDRAAEAALAILDKIDNPSPYNIMLDDTVEHFGDGIEV